jgi:arginine decarboxylase
MTRQLILNRAYKEKNMTAWSIEDAKEIYNVDHWSDGFFNINEKGMLEAFPKGKYNHHCINLQELSESLLQENLTFPILVRFTDILKTRLDQLTHAFDNVMSEANYQGHYTPVYPIKVNQQSGVVNALLEHGKDRIGLEAGSKPELMAVLALTHQANALIVCNGYKDREYIRLALIGQMLGKKVYIILEKLSELDLVLEEAARLNITPRLGIRIRLASMGAGRWQNSGGEKSKFGFSAEQILYVIERLRKMNSLSFLQILHFHLGSQIANIADIQRGMHECARYYAELRRMGANIDTVDVGGGLGIDYEGTHSRSFCSKNYSMQEYANNIIYTLIDICNKHDLPHPNVITESGRALTAHHALLITNIIGCEAYSTIEYSAIQSHSEEEPTIIKELRISYESLSKRTAIETYHDICHYIGQINNMFNYGLISLADRAQAEQIYRATCVKIQDLLNPSIRSHREILDELNEKLADKYFCNFSVFQSLPDSWAINQVFPILPISGLDQEPTKRVTLQDLTCDSDGCIKSYIDGQALESTLSLAPYQADKPYLLGIFLVGAYQEILGDMHNLFGDTDSVHVELLPQEGYRLVQPEMGDTVDDVLRYVHYDTQVLLDQYQQQLSKAKLSPEQYDEFLYTLTEGLKGYTYLEQDIAESASPKTLLTA